MSVKAETLISKYKIADTDPLYAFFHYLEEKDDSFEDRNSFIEKSINEIKVSSEEISEVLKYSKLNIKARFLGVGALGLVLGITLGAFLSLGYLFYLNPTYSSKAISFRDSLNGPVLYILKDSISSMKNTDTEVEIKLRE